MDMDAETLRWFASVADGMTVTEVAQEHGVSQPGVSRALARLEAEVATSRAPCTTSRTAWPRSAS
jgi:DNA-binding transcriptional LysR family regulator